MGGNPELIKMKLLLILVCFSTFLQASLPIPLLASKPKPVFLSNTCIEILDPETKKHEDDGVPIILIHGMTQNKETWHGVFENIAYATKKKVCALDLRNHGQSPWNDEEYDVEAMTEDVKHFIDVMRVPKVILLGHSLGGKVALHLTLNYPEKVEKLIVEDMRTNGFNPKSLKGDQFYARMLKDLLKHIPQEVTEKEAKEEVLKLIKDQLEKINITFPDDLSAVPIKCSNGKCQLSFNPVLLDAILRNFTDFHNESSGRFDGPVLFIYGTESAVKLWEDESNIKKLFPNAELVPVEGADHMVHKSKKFLTEVIKFINSK